MMVRMVTAAAAMEAARVTAVTMVCWLPASTLYTSEGVIDDRRFDDVEPRLDEVELAARPKMSCTMCGRFEMKSPDCVTSGTASAIAPATSTPMVAIDTTRAASIRFQPCLTRKVTAGARPMASTMPMKTHSSI